MNLDAISVWLKTTIPGIITLSGFGSIFAAIIIWLSKKYLLPSVLQYIKNILTKFMKHFIAQAARKFVDLHFAEGENKTYAFFTLLLMKLILSLFIALCCFIIFLFALNNDNQILFRVSVLAPLIIFFLSIWYSMRCFTVALVPLFMDVEKLISEKAEEISQKYNTNKKS